MKLLISQSATKLSGNSLKASNVLKAATKDLASFKGGNISVVQADTVDLFKIKLSSSIKASDLQKLMGDLAFIANSKDWLEIQNGLLVIVRVQK